MIRYSSVPTIVSVQPGTILEAKVPWKQPGTNLEPPGTNLEAKAFWNQPGTNQEPPGTKLEPTWNQPTRLEPAWNLPWLFVQLW